MIKQKTNQLGIFRYVLRVGLICLLLVSLVSLAKAKTAEGATSSTLNFQARLLNGAGAIVPDGTYNIEFKLYNVSSAGTALWTETRTSTDRVTVKAGYLSVHLGSVTGLPGLNWNEEHWLTMNIGGTGGSPTWDGEMSPRIKLTAVPFAFQAEQLAKTSGANRGTLGFNTVANNPAITLPDATGTVCLQTASACGFASGSGTAWLQSGNNFGGTTGGILGTVNNGALDLITNNTTRLSISGAGAVQIQSGSLSVGTTSQQGSLAMHDGNGQTATISVGSGLAANTALAIPTGVGTSDTFCLETLANCTGGAGGAPNSAEYLTLSSNSTLSAERVLTSGSNLTFTDGGANGNFTVATVQNPTFTTSVTTPLLTSSGALTVTPGGAMILGATGQTALLRGSTLSLTSTGATNDITLTSADQIILDSTGTIELQDGANITGALGVTSTATIGTLGAASNNTVVCRNGSNQLATCTSTFATTANAFLQSGNSFGATGVLGTTDSNGLQVITNSVGRAYFDTSNNLYLGNAGTTGTAAAPNNFLVQGTGSATAGTAGGSLGIIGGAGATTGAGSVGGVLTLQGGSGGSTNIAGGNIVLAGGRGTGTAAGGNILFQIAAPGSSGSSNNALTTVGTISGTNGTVLLQPTADTTTAFNVKTSLGNNHFTVDTLNSRVGINLGSSNVPAATLEVQGSLRISGLVAGGTNVDDFITPGGGSVETAINIPIYDPGANGQVMAMGIPASTVFTSSRVLSIFDARTVAHQPSIGLFSPDQNNILGFSWDGGNTTSYLKTTGGNIGIRSNATDIATFTPTAVSLLQNTTITGTLDVQGGSITNSTGAMSVSGNTTLTLQSTGANAVSLDSTTTGAVNIATSNNGKTIQVGSTTLSSGTQTIGIGNNNTSGGTTNVTIGTGTSATGGTTTVQAKGALTLTGGAASTWSTSTGLLTVAGGSGLTMQATGNNALTLQTNGVTRMATTGAGATTITGGTAGDALTVSNSSSTGNILVLQDNATPVFTVADGGNITATGTLDVRGGSITNTTGAMALSGNTTLTLQSTGANAVSVDSTTTGAVNIGTSNNGKTIQIGSTTLSSGTQVIGIGNNNTSGGTTNITIGTGTSATAGTTTVQAKGVLTLTGTGGITATGAAASSLTTSAGGLTLTGAAASTWSTSTGLLTVAGGSGLTLQATGSNPMTLQTNGVTRIATTGTGATTVTGGTSGDALTVSNSSSTGNILVLQDNATPVFTVADGGNIISTGQFQSASGTAAAPTYAFSAEPDTGMYNGGTNLLDFATNGTKRLEINATGEVTAQVGTDSATAFQLQNSLGATLLGLDSRQTNNLAANSGAETSGTFSTNWTTVGTATITRDTTAANVASGSAAASVAAGTTSNNGVRNNLASNPATGTTHIISFSAKLGSGSAFTDIDVEYSYNGGTNLTPCTSYSSQTILTTEWKKITCTLTTPANSVTDADLIIRQPTAPGVARTFYIDNLSMVAQNSSGTQNNGVLRIGGSTSQGLTLLTLDTYAGTPFSGTNKSLSGSMYFDTSQNKIQCYDGDSWGACGAAPDNIVTLTPEYSGAVLNGSGIGTMTADFCGNDGGGSFTDVNTSFCASGEARNFYRWTSPQASYQTYSVYVTYKLPSTFKSFVNGTATLTGRVDDTTNSGVSYQILRSTGGSLTSCSATKTVVGWTGSAASGSANTWTPGSPTTDPSTCSFAANDYVVIQVSVTAKSNANAYIENLQFRYSNQ